MKKTLAVLIPAVFAQATGNVFLSMRMKEVGSSNWVHLLPRAMESPTLWIGTVLLIISFVLFAAALSWADLSYVIPTVSIEVIVNVVFARYFLGEAVSLSRWAGVVLISLGVLLVVRSGDRNVRPESEDLTNGGTP